MTPQLRTPAVRLAFACALALAVGCAKTAPASGGLGDPCIANGDCAAGFACTAGRCELPANLGGCEPGRKRCNGSDVEQCAENGQGYSFVRDCPTGCTAGACRPQACTPGARRCEGDAAEQCTPGGEGWALVQVCPSHCSSDTGTCKAPVCTPFAVRCDPAGANAVQTCDSFGAAWESASCASGTICDSGRCQGVVCAAGATRCAAGGAAVETCNALGDGWTASASCGFGCNASASSGSCADPACSAGQRRCELSALEECRPDRTGFAFVNFCASGCVAGSGGGQAGCAPPVCAPGSKSCADPLTPRICNSDGAGWTALSACPIACAGGECTDTGANCTPGDLRCNGGDAQACVATAGITQWTTKAACLGGCSSGACGAGGSCDPSTLKLNLAASPVPIDGASSVLVYSDVIRGADGSVLPDGTSFTAQVDAPATIDANAPGGAVRVQSIGGRVHFAVRSPAKGTAAFTANAVVALVAGASCTASTAVAFAAPPGAPAPQTVLIAEDFLTSGLRNVGQTTADWSTAKNALVADWPTPVGSGEDGQLCLYAGGAAPDAAWGCASWQTGTSGTLNLSSSYAASYAVLGLTSQGVTLDRPAAALSGGDEVMLWDAQGSAAGFANAGSYELLHVRATDGSAVSFVEPVRGTYGAIADQNVSTQRVVLQRVPHFSQVVVLQGATLTVDPWDGARGGLLPMRVSGSAELHGLVDASSAGFRGGPSGAASWGEDQTGATSLGVTGAGAGHGSGSGGHATPGLAGNDLGGQAYGLPLLGRIFAGSGGGGGVNVSGGAGGGAIFLSAGRINLASGPLGQPAGLVRADGQPRCGGTSGSGAGGSIWLSAPSLLLAASGAQLSAQSGASLCSATNAGQGRIRIDSLGAASPCSRAAGGCTVGLGGPLQAQSLDAFNAGSLATIKQATLLLALGAPQAGAAFAASAGNADPPDFGAIASPSGACTASAGAVGTVCFSSAGSPAQGPRFRWRAQLSPAPDQQIEALVQGLQWSLKVQ